MEYLPPPKRSTIVSASVFRPGYDNTPLTHHSHNTTHNTTHNTNDQNIEFKYNSNAHVEMFPVCHC